MTERHPDEIDLERLFAAERAAPPVPSAELLARVLADAQDALRPRKAARPTLGQRLAGVIRDLGGWPTIAGLATAGIAGLWIGIDPPPVLRDTVTAFWAADGMDYLVDLAPDDLFSPEEGTTL